VVKGLTLSAGGQVTSYKLGDGAYLNDMSFVTSSYSLGFGAKFKIAKNASVNIAYFFTDYSHKKKEYDQTIVAAGQSVDVHCTDDFTRTNKVLGVGLDVDF
jgi:opacity protein-like surface antigen